MTSGTRSRTQINHKTVSKGTYGPWECQKCLTETRTREELENYPNGNRIPSRVSLSFELRLLQKRLPRKTGPVHTSKDLKGRVWLRRLTGLKGLCVGPKAESVRQHTTLTLEDGVRRLSIYPNFTKIRKKPEPRLNPFCLLLTEHSQSEVCVILSVCVM